MNVRARHTLSPLLLALTLCWPTLATGQQPQSPDASLTQRLDAPESPQVGQPLTLTLRVEHPPGARVVWPEQLPNPRWKIVQRAITQAPGEASTVSEATLTLVVMRAGRTTLAPLEIGVVQGDGVTTLQGEPIVARVRSTLDDPDTASWRAPRGGVVVTAQDYRPVWYGLGAAGALALALLGLWAWRRRESLEELPAQRAYHEVATARLQALAERELVASGQLVPYYTDLSEILRAYLGARWQLPGTELTTSELRARLSREVWPAGLSPDDVSAWLRRADRVKFTAWRPDAQEAEADLRYAHLVVALTWQQRQEELERLAAEAELVRSSSGKLGPTLKAAAPPSPSTGAVARATAPKAVEDAPEGAPLSSRQAQRLRQIARADEEASSPAPPAPEGGADAATGEPGAASAPGRAFGAAHTTSRAAAVAAASHADDAPGSAPVAASAEAHTPTLELPPTLEFEPSSKWEDELNPAPRELDARAMSEALDDAWDTLDDVIEADTPPRES